MAPHVLNYAEICDAANKDQIIYEELRVLGLVRPLKFDGLDFKGVKHNCYLLLMECDEDNCPDYGVHYRCWNEEPSTELMNSTPWKNSPFQND